MKPHPYLGHSALVTALGHSGVRVSEMCDLRIGQIRLHDPDGARFQIADAKTEAGIREVQTSPDLGEEGWSPLGSVGPRRRERARDGGRMSA